MLTVKITEICTYMVLGACVERTIVAYRVQPFAKDIPNIANSWHTEGEGEGNRNHAGEEGVWSLEGGRGRRSCAYKGV